MFNFKKSKPRNRTLKFNPSAAAAAAAKALQWWLTLCDPIDGSPPGFHVPGILKARILPKWHIVDAASSSVGAGGLSVRSNPAGAPEPGVPVSWSACSIQLPPGQAACLHLCAISDPLALDTSLPSSCRASWSLPLLQVRTQCVVYNSGAGE